MSVREKFLLGVWMGVLAASVAMGASGDLSSGIQGPTYDTDRQTLAAPNTRTALAVADTLTTAAVLALPEFQVQRRQSVFVGARFTNAAQTCQVQLAYVYKISQATTASATSTANNKIKGWSSVITLIGSSSQKEGSYYESPDAFFDAEGAVTVRVVLIAAPAAGTVTLVAGS